MRPVLYLRTRSQFTMRDSSARATCLREIDEKLSGLLLLHQSYQYRTAVPTNGALEPPGAGLALRWYPSLATKTFCGVARPERRLHDSRRDPYRKRHYGCTVLSFLGWLHRLP